VAVRAATASGVRPPLFEAGTEQDTGGVEYKLLRLPPGREGNTRNRITSHVQSRERRVPAQGIHGRDRLAASKADDVERHGRKAAFACFQSKILRTRTDRRALCAEVVILRLFG
jgi:hypothetical protein